MSIRTLDELNHLAAALDIVVSSEHVGEECESANHHSLQDFLREIRDTLHVCDFSGEHWDYSEGDYEVACTNKGCHRTEYFES